MGRPPQTSLWLKIEPLLALVERPSRYIDHEFNRVTKPDAEYRAAFVYPDTYEIGQANQAIALLYSHLNAMDGVAAERAYLPWLDMIGLMREQGIPLFALESARPLAGFDLVGITIPHELACTNVLEVLDLAGLPLHSDQRDEGHPLVVGGGPGCFNPEPLAGFFDCFAIGESEQLITELVSLHRELADRPRAELLAAISRLDGMYVPSQAHTEPQRSIRRRVYMGFSDSIEPACLVPFTEVVHDRLTIEVIRGCSRGCRFCQAGMTYRPVRERPGDMVVSAVTSSIAETGFDEVSLASLSTTDHSSIESILRRLKQRYQNTGVSVSLPSQRLDAFGVGMAQLASGERKAGLTFAPEAGSQRLRDVINKNVSADDLLGTVKAAYQSGYRRCKLYFMIGLPTETDEDILAITELVNSAYDLAKDSVPDSQRSQVRITVSVAVFVPKPATPFQWCGQEQIAEVERRIALLRASGLRKGVDLSWHDPHVSQVEAALSRSGREAGSLIEAAWSSGALFAAWSDQFDYSKWVGAAVAAGLDLAALAEKAYSMDGELPWNQIDCGVSQAFLAKEWERALRGQTTPDCSFTTCQACGACDDTTPLVLSERSVAGAGAGGPSVADDPSAVAGSPQKPTTRIILESPRVEAARAESPRAEAQRPAAQQLQPVTPQPEAQRPATHQPKATHE